MIRDVLLPMLMERFPGRGLRTAGPPGLMASFPAAHPAVGDVTIWDDGVEATVAVGTIAHGHFIPYDERLTPEQIAERVTADVLSFLEDLFADRVLLWTSPDGGSGGWQIMGEDQSLSLLDEDDHTFTWSGPVKNPCDPLLKGITVDNLQLTQAPVAKTGMLIRKPVAEVFEAFVNPDIITQFWFTKGSGRLEAGKQVHWDWEKYGISIPVAVKAVEPNRRILIEWPGQGGATRVEWIFTSLEDGTTFVRITNDGFSGDGDALVKQAMDSTQGFSLVLAGLKALLEHDVRLNLVADRFPKGSEER